MKGAAALVVLVGVGFLAGEALGDSLPTPTVPAIPVPVPTAPVPLPEVPKLPTPVLVAPSSPSAGSGPVQVPSAGAGVVSSGGGSSETYNGSSSGSSGPSARSNRLQVKHFHASRPWIGTSGPKRRRTTTLTFVLPRAARVVFTVRQVSPMCRVAGRFAVAGHAGLNRVRFAGRVNGEQLESGTYKIAARTGGGRYVRQVTIVVVDGSAPSKAELAAARGSNVCQATRGIASAASNTGNSAYPQQVQRSFAPKTQPSARGPSKGSNTYSGALLASSVERAARAIRPVLVALLAVAILLLGLAALPKVAVPEPRFNDLLVRHRLEIAGLGAAALVVVAVAFLLG